MAEKADETSIPTVWLDALLRGIHECKMAARTRGKHSGDLDMKRAKVFVPAKAEAARIGVLDAAEGGNCGEADDRQCNICFHA